MRNLTVTSVGIPQKKGDAPKTGKVWPHLAPGQ